MSWIDFGNERGYFAQQMLLGLDTVAGFIREGTPQARKTVVASLLTHVREAIDWANNNSYTRFAGQLMLLREFVTLLN